MAALLINRLAMQQGQTTITAHQENFNLSTHRPILIFVRDNASLIFCLICHLISTIELIIN